MHSREDVRFVKKISGHSRGLGRASIIESHGPEGKVRGTVQQLLDRYTSLGKDAVRGGNAISAEEFFQHAEHYRRLLASVRRIESSQQPSERGEENTSKIEEGKMDLTEDSF